MSTHKSISEMFTDSDEVKQSATISREPGLTDAQKLEILTIREKFPKDAVKDLLRYCTYKIFGIPPCTEEQLREIITSAGSKEQFERKVLERQKKAQAQAASVVATSSVPCGRSQGLRKTLPKEGPRKRRNTATHEGCRKQGKELNHLHTYRSKLRLTDEQQEYLDVIFHVPRRRERSVEMIIDKFPAMEQVKYVQLYQAYIKRGARVLLPGWIFKLNVEISRARHQFPDNSLEQITAHLQQKYPEQSIELRHVQGVSEGWDYQLANKDSKNFTNKKNPGSSAGERRKQTERNVQLQRSRACLDMLIVDGFKRSPTELSDGKIETILQSQTYSRLAEILKLGHLLFMLDVGSSKELT